MHAASLDLASVGVQADDEECFGAVDLLDVGYGLVVAAHEAFVEPGPHGEHVPRQLPTSRRRRVGHRGDLHVQAPVAGWEGAARSGVLGVDVVLGDPALQIPSGP